MTTSSASRGSGARGNTGMVIDTSALIAMLFDEPEADRLKRAIVASHAAYVGAPTLVEATAVMLSRRKKDGRRAVDNLIARLPITVVEMSPTAARAAQRAYERYGKGVGAPGVLNFGDCLAYGMAKVLGEPLLFKGNDFAATDVRAAPY